MSDLQPGDRCYYLSKSLLKLRCIVAESLDLKTKGEETMVPVIRDIRKKKNLVSIDNPGKTLPPPKIKLIARSNLRKLPPKEGR